ncbi:ParB/RepB/Spo0J family partition protein [Priestia megaterium]|uniref:ParB/RepB/Spo0J family partition protein n=1 Tax=Priestia megaterium TaxID=1404 RepID=UPI00234F86C8|nr:ParB/RepB/Spo0J family partition protein [Priestia megaterium]MDC7783193.1 ParB/RepB/Spo0J family partition protein [Priestia megaterium]
MWDLKQLIGQSIMKTDETRPLSIKNKEKMYNVMIIPLEYCHYNEKNGRISTYISQYLSSGNELQKDDLETYNQVLERFIYESNPNALDKTKKNIQLVGQLEPGVVLNDGRIIDGNRRFTALRKLQAEGKTDIYFKAILLDQSEGIDDKDIKKLELQLQHGKEKPVEYNPIDNLVDIYQDIIENKLFTIEEYRKYVNKSEGEVKKMVKRSVLMNQFLHYINAEKQYYIARDWEFDTIFQDILTIIERELKGIDVITILDAKSKNRSEVQEYLRIRNALFTTAFSGRMLKTNTQTKQSSDDLSRYIRNIGKHIIDTDKKDEYLEEMEDVVDEMYDTLHDYDQLDLETIQKVSKDIEDKQQDVIIKGDDYIQSGQLNDAQTKPVTIIDKVLKNFDQLDYAQLKYMDDETEQNFLTLYNKLKAEMEKIEAALHV